MFNALPVFEGLFSQMFLLLLLASGLSGYGGPEDDYDYDDYGTSPLDGGSRPGKEGAPCPDEKCPKEEDL